MPRRTLESAGAVLTFKVSVVSTRSPIANLVDGDSGAGGGGGAGGGDGGGGAGGGGAVDGVAPPLTAAISAGPNTRLYTRTSSIAPANGRVAASRLPMIKLPPASESRIPAGAWLYAMVALAPLTYMLTPEGFGVPSHVAATCCHVPGAIALLEFSSSGPPAYPTKNSSPFDGLTVILVFPSLLSRMAPCCEFWARAGFIQAA